MLVTDRGIHVHKLVGIINKKAKNKKKSSKLCWLLTVRRRSIVRKFDKKYIVIRPKIKKIKYPKDLKDLCDRRCATAAACLISLPRAPTAIFFDHWPSLRLCLLSGRWNRINIRAGLNTGTECITVFKTSVYFVSHYCISRCFRQTFSKQISFVANSAHVPIERVFLVHRPRKKISIRIPYSGSDTVQNSCLFGKK